MAARRGDALCRTESTSGVVTPLGVRISPRTTAWHVHSQLPAEDPPRPPQSRAHRDRIDVQLVGDLRLALVRENTVDDLPKRLRKFGEHGMVDGQDYLFVLGLRVRPWHRRRQFCVDRHMAMEIACSLALRGAEEISGDCDRVRVCTLGIDPLQGLRDSYESELREIFRHVRGEPPLEEPQERGPQRYQQTV